MNVITKWLVLLIGVLLLIGSFTEVPYSAAILAILVIIIGIVELMKKK